MDMNLTDEVKKKCAENGDRYLRSVEYNAAKLLHKIVEDLPDEARLVSANIINAMLRDADKSVRASTRITQTPESFIRYLLNDYSIYVEFGTFWVFDGVMVQSEPIMENGKYKQNRYPTFVHLQNDDDLEALIESLKDPEKLHNAQKPVRLQKGEEPCPEQIADRTTFYCQ
jgi:hypothetical protein